MFRMFKRCACFFLIAMLLISLSACKQENTASDETESVSETITLYSTFYPLYALTDMVVDGVDGIRTMCLVQPQDGCLRNYELSDWDLVLLLRSADAVISGGRGLESFESTLFALEEHGPAVSAVLYNMELDSTSVVGLNEEVESHWENNPHIYMSVDGAIELTQRISAVMQTLDPDFADVYIENQLSAESALYELKAQMQEIIGDVSGTKIAILNEAIWYFAKDFDFDAVLCYHRESGEDINNIDTLMEYLNSSGAELILIEKQAPYALCEALKDAGYAVAKIDILYTHRAEEGSDGYFEAQISNANALKTAMDTITSLGGTN